MSSLFQLLTMNFVKLVVLSMVLAVPIAWYAMNIWLQDYTLENRVEISWIVFAVAGILTLAIAIFTVSYESMKVVQVDPAESLRSE